MRFEGPEKSCLETSVARANWKWLPRPHSQDLGGSESRTIRKKVKLMDGKYMTVAGSEIYGRQRITSSWQGDQQRLLSDCLELECRT